MTEALCNASVAGAIAVLGAATILGFSNFWLFALFEHLRRHIAGLALLMMPLAVLTTGPPALKILMGGGALVICAFNIMWMRRATPGSPTVGRDGVVLRVIFANVLDSNERFGLLVEWVKAEQADILMASEVTEQWVAALRALEPQLPYGHGARHGEVAILSRLPIARTHDDPSLSFARIAAAEIVTSVGPVELVVVHPRPRLRAALAAVNVRVIAAAAKLAGKARGGVIVAGDFNTPPWSPAFSGMVAQCGLTFGRGAWRATWPTWLPGWLGLPFDHILAGGGCTIVDRRHGPRIGSDHRPILADIRCIPPLSAP
jgi:endonuclease/exonuclease/phosphatase (EEP) superfamily protein YafD